MIVKLYPSILVPLLSEWTNDRDLCAFDSAVCKKDLRSCFLSLISKCWISHTIKEPSSECLTWMLMRGIRLQKYTLGNHNCLIMSNELCTMLKAVKRVKHIVAGGCVDFAELIVNYGITVDSLKLLSSKSEDILYSILTNLGGVLHLDLASCFVLSQRACSIIASTCPNLKVLIVSQRAEVGSILEQCNVDSIRYCNCQYVFPEPILSRSFSCELVKSHDEDKNAVLIHDRCYTIRSLLIHQQMREDQVSIVRPYIADLESLELKNDDSTIYNQRPLLTVIAAKCSALTSVSFLVINIDTSDWLSLLRNAPLIRSISLRYCEIETESCLVAIARYCSHLESFNFDKTETEGSVNADEAMLELFDKCRKLTNVALDSVVMSEAAFCRAIKNVQSLEFIPCFDGFVVNRDNDCGLDRAVVSCKTMPADENLLTLCSNNPDLRKLCFRMSHELRAATIEALTLVCPALEYISFCCSAAQSDDFLLPLAQCQHLTALHIYGLDLRSNALEEFLKSKSQLRKLSLIFCCGEVQSIFRLLPKHCPTIEWVDVTVFKIVEPDDVIYLLNNCVNLYWLNLKGCKNIVEEVLPHINMYRMRKLVLGKA